MFTLVWWGYRLFHTLSESWNEPQAKFPKSLLVCKWQRHHFNCVAVKLLQCISCLIALRFWLTLTAASDWSVCISRLIKLRFNKGPSQLLPAVLRRSPCLARSHSVEPPGLCLLSTCRLCCFHEFQEAHSQARASKVGKWSASEWAQPFHNEKCDCGLRWEIIRDLVLSEGHAPCWIKEIPLQTEGTSKRNSSSCASQQLPGQPSSVSS